MTEEQFVNANMRKQAGTVNKIEKTMRAKIEELIPIFEKMPAAQTITNTQGERVLKANPATQEIRATFRDYCAIVRVQRDIFAKETTPADTSTLQSLRRRFKVVNKEEPTA